MNILPWVSELGAAESMAVSSEDLPLKKKKNDIMRKGAALRGPIQTNIVKGQKIRVEAVREKIQEEA